MRRLYGAPVGFWTVRDHTGRQEKQFVIETHEHKGDFKEWWRGVQPVSSSFWSLIGCSHEYRSITFGLSWPYTFDVAFYRTLPSSRGLVLAGALYLEWRTD